MHITGLPRIIGDLSLLLETGQQQGWKSTQDEWLWSCLLPLINPPRSYTRLPDKVYHECLTKLVAPPTVGNALLGYGVPLDAEWAKKLFRPILGNLYPCEALVTDQSVKVRWH